MMSIGERLRQARLEKKWSQRKLAERANIKQQSLHNIETNASKGGRSLEKLAEALSVDPSWLRFGNHSASGHNPNGQPTVRLLPLIEWEKIGMPLNHKDITRIPVLSDTCHQDSYFLSIENDTMIPEKSGEKPFMINDLIGVDPQVSPKSGQYVIAKTQAKTTPIFRQYIKDGANAYLKPLNPQYPIIEIKSGSSISLIGLVFIQIRYPL